MGRGQDSKSKDLIVSSRGLLVKDEADQTVRYAHHTVQHFLAQDVLPDDLLKYSCHFADRAVGDVCVAYLLFSDFETQIAIRPPSTTFEPTGVLRNRGALQIPSLLGLSRYLFELPYKFLGSKATPATSAIDYAKYLKPRAKISNNIPSGLVKKYQLLEYITTYWMLHTRNFVVANRGVDENTRLNKRLLNLVMHRTLSFEFPPCGPNFHFGPYGCKSCPNPAQSSELPFMSLFHYAAEIGHWPLMLPLLEKCYPHERYTNETLLIACRHGQETIVRELIERRPFDLSDGRAVNMATASGHEGVVNYLLSTGENRELSQPATWVYSFENNGHVPFSLPATHGHSCPRAIAEERRRD